MRLAIGNLRLWDYDRRPAPAAPAAVVLRAGLRRIAIRQSKLANAFTLVELIISIGLVLIVMLGVNFVFRMTGDTIGSGQVLSEQVRNNRGAQAIMFEDFGNMMPDGPFLFIRSQRVAAFRNAQDRLSDPSGSLASPTDAEILSRDIDGDGNEATIPAEAGQVALLSDRNHRVDRIGFFAQGLFRRQTGNDGQLVGDVTSNEAYVWYGHLKRPDFTSPTGDKQVWEHRNPGEKPYDQNANNALASQFILGRVQMLLREPDSSGNIYDRAGTTAQVHYRRADPWNNYTSVSPFSDQARSSEATAADRSWLSWSRYDLMGGSTRLARPLFANYVGDWWTEISNFRFQGNPFVVRPISATSAAKTVPVFLDGCTQFVVEYAGDFVEQATSGANTGRVIGLQPDGVIDFVAFNPGQASERREIRWHGFPRDINGDGVIRAKPMLGGANDLVDVVPLRDIYRTAGGTNASFERDLSNLPVPGSDFYANVNQTSGLLAPGTDADPTRYICAWGPNDTVRPKMIRVTIVLDDTSGRLAEGQTLEYVFQLP